MSEFADVLASVQDAGEDFEWYPTTDRMIAVVARHLPTDCTHTLLDIGAGDGRVLLKLAEKFEHKPKLYAIEKSNVLIQSQPEDVIPVGTDLFEQNLCFLPVDFIFCNPPYSQFEAWASVIIETGHAKRAFLVIPQRWKDSAAIAEALKKRHATTRVIHTDNFADGARPARAVVDIVEVSFPMKKSEHGYRSDEPQDPFDAWFEQNVSTFDEEAPEEDCWTRKEREQTELAHIRNAETIAAMVDAYNEEHERMQANYRAIFQLDYALLKELGVKKAALRDGIKAKITGLKSKYWGLLFERLDVVTERLSTETKKRFLEKLTDRATLAFTSNNAYAVVLWAIKNANRYFDEQTVKLFRDLSTFDGVANYKSNTRTWDRQAWRYRSVDYEDQRPTHYGLDYRIVVEKWRAIKSGDDWSGRYTGNLDDGCHELIDDIRAVLYNLGFQTTGGNPRNRTWSGGEWQDWLTRDGDVLFQVKGYKNGNLHLRFMSDAIKALNVEAGRLLGWLRAPQDVESELGYTPTEARRFFNSTKLIAPSNVRLLAAAEVAEDEPPAPLPFTPTAQPSLF